MKISPKEFVLTKHPHAFLFKSVTNRFQIWVRDAMLFFAGEKLGEANSEAGAWLAAAKKIRENQ